MANRKKQVSDKKLDEISGGFAVPQKPMPTQSMPVIKTPTRPGPALPPIGSKTGTTTVPSGTKPIN